MATVTQSWKTLISIKLSILPTHDSGTLIDHMYISSHLTCESTVADCYFSDHDFIYGVIQQLKHYISCTCKLQILSIVFWCLATLSTTWQKIKTTIHFLCTTFYFTCLFHCCSIHATSLYIILRVILCENKLIIFVCHKVLFFYFLLCVPWMWHVSIQLSKQW